MPRQEFRIVEFHIAETFFHRVEFRIVEKLSTGKRRPVDNAGEPKNTPGGIKKGLKKISGWIFRAENFWAKKGFDKISSPN